MSAANAMMQDRHKRLEEQVPTLQAQLKDSQDRSIALTSASLQFQSSLGHMAGLLTTQTNQAMGQVADLRIANERLLGEFQREADSSLSVIQEHLNEAGKLLSQATTFAASSGLRMKVATLEGTVGEVHEQLNQKWSKLVQDVATAAVQSAKGDLAIEKKNAISEVSRNEFIKKLSAVELQVDELRKRLDGMGKPTSTSTS